MKSKSDQYNFDQISKSGNPGFEPFKNEENKTYYFHFNDKEGKALLYSQAYKSAKSRDKGQTSTMANMKDTDNYTTFDENGVHTFAIKAKNNQEIARSRPFSAKTKMRKAIQFITQYLESEETTPDKTLASAKKETGTTKKSTRTKAATSAAENKSKSKSTKTKPDLNQQWAKIRKSKDEYLKLVAQLEEMIKAEEVSLQKKAKAANEVYQKSIRKAIEAEADNLPANKSSFRIDLYQNSGDGNIQGRIQHLLSRSKISFNGVDINVIQQFLNSYLPTTTTTPSPTTVAPPVVQPPTISKGASPLVFFDPSDTSIPSQFAKGMMPETGSFPSSQSAARGITPLSEPPIPSIPPMPEFSTSTVSGQGQKIEMTPSPSFATAHSLDTARPSSAVVNIDPDDFPSNTTLNVQIDAIGMGVKKQAVIGNMELEFTGQNNLSIPLNTSALLPGSYRLIAKISGSHQGKSTANQAFSMVQAY